MRIAEYKKTGTKTEEYKVNVPAEYDEENNIISEEHEEVRIREVPVMGMVYRDMTPEEVEELQKLQAEMPEPEPEPTVEERVTTLESASDDIILLMADLIGGEE